MAPSAVCSGIYLYKTAASKLTNKSIKWEERKPIGIRFNPSDEVLLRDFLLLKVRGRLGNLASGFIKLTDVYKYEPGELIDREYDFGEGKMYFFTKLSKKYPTTRKKCSGSQRTIIARTVPGSGFWKKTGLDSSVVFMDNDVKRKGTKTSLAFYKNDEKSGKTPWLMKEYMLDGQSYEESGMSEDPLVLCVVYYYDNGNQNQRESENESRADMVVDSDSDGKRLRPSSDFDTFLDQPLWKKPIVDMVVEFNSNEKRLRPSLDLDLPSQYIFNCNLDHTATFQQWLHFQFLTSNPNMPTLGAPDSNLQYPVGTVLDQAPHASNGISGECFGPDYEQPLSYNQPNLLGKPSSDVGLWSDIITDTDLLGQNPAVLVVGSSQNLATSAPEQNSILDGQYPVDTLLDQAPHASNGISGECFGPNYERPLSYNQQDLLGKPSPDVGLWSDIITDTDLLGQNPEVLVVGSSQNLATSAPEQNSILDGQYPVDTLLDQAPHASNGISGECFGPNYERPLSYNQPDLLGKPSSDVGLWSDIISDTDLLGQNPEVLVVGSSQNLATLAPEQNSILDGQYPVDTLLDQAPHASNGISGECFGPNYERPLSNNQPDLLGKPSSDVGLLSDIITDTDLLGGKILRRP